MGAPQKHGQRSYKSDISMIIGIARDLGEIHLLIL